MADTYTLKTYTEEELKTLEDKDKEVTKEALQAKLDAIKAKIDE